MEHKNQLSVLIGGKAGDGIDRAGAIIGSLLGRQGFYTYIYRDYPSIIRGGHTFSIIRAACKRIYAHEERIDLILALNQDTINLHINRLKDNSVIIYNSDVVKLPDIPFNIKAFGIAIEKIIKEINAPVIMRNSCIIGILCKLIGIKQETVEDVFKKEFPKEIDLNLQAAERGYNAVEQYTDTGGCAKKMLPALTGNEAIGLGFIKGGLDSYIAYPMTPSSGILHFLGSVGDKFSLKVIHPESEIAVILMALGFSYIGKRVAVGTSGGGFCLMAEGLSLSGMAELPVAIVLGQRTGPSTGLPTYTGQAELGFALGAGHGEFSRLVVAPGDLEEAYFWSAASLNIAYAYQVPAIILSDKTLSEGVYNFDIEAVGQIMNEPAVLWDRKGEYKRYSYSQNGVSPLAFAPDKGVVIKVNSYEHDEYGITTEDAVTTKSMQEKRLSKEILIGEALKKYKTVGIYGNPKSKAALLCWGSNKGVCLEAAENLGLKVVQPIVLNPLPEEEIKKALAGIEKIVLVENSYTGQLERLLKLYSIKIDQKILKYDGRPFALDELIELAKKAIDE